MLWLLVLATAVVTSAVWSTHASAQATSQSQTPAPQAPKPTQAPPSEAGGPTGDIGPIAIPKKKTEDTTPPPVRRPREKEPEFTITTDVPLVTLDVLVTTKDGMFVPGLKQQMFRVLEDGVPQRVASFGQKEAPITAVLLIEFAKSNYAFMTDALRASYTFAQMLKKEDWIAVIAYDMKPEILADFTQDKNQVYGALGQLRIPGFSETNLFDSLYDTIDRVADVEGRKYIILISSGCDTFSRITYDKVLKKVQGANNTVIYGIGTGQAMRQWAETSPYGDITRFLPCTNPLGSFETGAARTDFLQADNQMNTFARLTGGKAYFPKFEGQFPEIFRDIAATIRNEYTLTYHPTNPKLDGTFRKLKIELVDGEGKPLRMRDEKGKELKYQIIARDGYTAKHVVD